MIDLTKYKEFLKFSIGQVNKNKAKTITFKVYQTNKHTLKLVVGNYTYIDKDYQSKGGNFIEGDVTVNVKDLSIIGFDVTTKQVRKPKRNGSGVPLGARFY